MKFDFTITSIVFVAGIGLLLSAVSFFMTLRYWSRSFRPIVTAMVKTHSAGNVTISYDLQVLNCGSLPAKNIRLKAKQEEIEPALGGDASSENKRRWLSCFEAENIITILHNNESIKCSFGTSEDNDSGFWRYRAIVPIVIEYYGWFGKHYIEKQEIQIIDSESFTGFFWG